MAPTPSQSNAQACREFVPTLHTTPYPAIDPSAVRLPCPYVVCIVGGRGAAGGGLARSYARAGASGIILAARTRSALEDTASEVRNINPTVKVIVAECDITSAASVEALASTTKAAFDGRLDVVLVNSGYSGPMTADVVQESPIDFRTAFEVNTIGTFHAAHCLLPLLLDTESGAKAFVAISSMATPTISGHTHYCVSKAAQARFVEMLHEQYASRGVFCVSVHPGGLKSEFSEKSMPKQFHHREWIRQFCPEGADLTQTLA
ncbi:NAD(P)-binding protein [Aspergillus heteromorphus CBS 117.55]|uniref:NAD(P)-binding protein n=1 Tax=Aspergillus heteromorphus CBS 117.55 TaxID=1448321 RepID=A0A317V666_9EURO|nr:NAD(P)-binding protein [Aspergillus heteromorphus CBS 117.55]PWY69803.1 NAD(P)-binding protein [Aspergillus heteromorphus CBS 117.55]